MWWIKLIIDICLDLRNAFHNFADSQFRGEISKFYHAVVVLIDQRSLGSVCSV